MANKIEINRAPVLTLWAAVVAERLGYEPDTALTLGKAVAGLNAQSKGRRLGIYEEREGPEGRGKPEAPRREGRGERWTQLMGRSVPAVETDQGLRATAKGEPIDPLSVQRYLKGKLGENLDAVRAAMEDLAYSYTPDQLSEEAYTLYEKFRPSIPEGRRGWERRESWISTASARWPGSQGKDSPSKQRRAYLQIQARLAGKTLLAKSGKYPFFPNILHAARPLPHDR